MYKLIFFVPSSHAEAVKNAVFQAGGGDVGAYKKCCWQVEGQAQFMPCQDAKPFIGTPGQLEVTLETKVEIIVQQEALEGCVAALKLAHPYEAPVYHVLRLEDF